MYVSNLDYDGDSTMAWKTTAFQPKTRLELSVQAIAEGAEDTEVAGGYPGSPASDPAQRHGGCKVALQ